METKYRICKWCLERITDEFVATDEGDYLHVECYREYDKVIQTTQNNELLIH